MWHQNHFCCCKLLFFWSFQFSISKSHFLLSKQFHRNALSSVIKLSLLVVVVVYKLISIVSIVKSFVATDLAIVQQSYEWKMRSTVRRKWVWMIDFQKRRFPFVMTTTSTTRTLLVFKEKGNLDKNSNAITVSAQSVGGIIQKANKSINLNIRCTTEKIGKKGSKVPPFILSMKMWRSCTLSQIPYIIMLLHLSGDDNKKTIDNFSNKWSSPQLNSLFISVLHQKNVHKTSFNSHENNKIYNNVPSAKDV